MFKANNLITPLSKLINLDVNASKKYWYDLFLQENFDASDTAAIQGFAAVGRTSVIWIGRV